MRIVAFAYACEPDEGSEPGAGWMWARMLARLGETWVITRENNRAAIEAALPEIAERDQLHFEYVDLPAWARFWKRGPRGVHPYYALWQFAALKRARSLRRSRSFDLAWHLTFANAWLGSTAGSVGTRFVYGPVGGGVKTPWKLVPALGLRGTLQELIRIAVRGAARYGNPMARLAWRRADLILAQNVDTRDWLPSRYRAKVEVFPNAVVESNSVVPPSRSGAEKVALFAGRLTPWKGTDLAVRVIARLPGWKLLVAGAGSDKARMGRLAEQLAISDRVEFLGRIPQPQLFHLMYDEANVLLAPSMHDDAPWVVVEAGSRWLPVVAIDRGGPPLLGAFVVKPGTVRETVEGLAVSVAAMGSGEWNPTALAFDLEARFERLRQVLIHHQLLHTTPEREEALDE